MSHNAPLIQSRNVDISVLNGALWNMEQVHWEICKLCQFIIFIQENAVPVLVWLAMYVAGFSNIIFKHYVVGDM